MKVVILAGGLGTRLSEETENRPKPMVEVGGKPILWHIMKYYAHFGFNEFVIALGYKGEMVKRYMVDYASVASDLTVTLKDGRYMTHGGNEDDWRVHLIDTGQTTETGGRIKRLQSIIGNERFMMTFGDGLSTVDLPALLAYHESHGKLATLTAARPPARFGHLDIGEAGQIEEFSEKPQTGEGWINGGFFVLEPGVFDYIAGDETSLERDPLPQLAKDGQLMAYQHYGFWQCMDTLREKKLLESLWSGNAPWKVWK